MGDETKLQGGRTGECDEQVRALLERAQDPSRVLALSDGGFAIIITLLVLEIHVPELTQGHTLTEALAEVRPSFYAFAVSFIWPACTGSATAPCSPSWSGGAPPPREPADLRRCTGVVLRQHQGPSQQPERDQEYADFT